MIKIGMMFQDLEILNLDFIIYIWSPWSPVIHDTDHLQTPPNKVLKYTREHSVNEHNPIKSRALAYQYLYLKHLNKHISIEEILKHYDIEFGLIDTGKSKCTSILEYLIGKLRSCHTHSILHDAYGTFYHSYGFFRGYFYLYSYATNWMTKSPLIGYLSGVLLA